MPSGAGIQGHWYSWIQGREGVGASGSRLTLALPLVLWWPATLFPSLSLKIPLLLGDLL